MATRPSLKAGTNNIGAQLGYRSFDVGYLVDQDTGSFTLKGLYFGVVARY